MALNGVQSHRFRLVLDGEAALDNETGLVWHLQAGTSQLTWDYAVAACWAKSAGGRAGFRLPKADELATLLAIGSSPALPPYHPFVSVVLNQRYWSSTTSTADPTFARTVRFEDGTFATVLKASPGRFMCVRGPGAPE